jgi:hypothetical protein
LANANNWTSHPDFLLATTVCAPIKAFGPIKRSGDALEILAETAIERNRA